MKPIKNKNMRNLPDVSHELKADVEGALDGVGMTHLDLPLRLNHSEMGVITVPASADVFVSLDDPRSKGIHMSRLYLQLQKELAEKELSGSLIKNLLTHFVEKQEGISQSSELKLKFKLPVQRKALVSEAQGWRYYPVWLKARFHNKQFKIFLGGTVTYSSTCPCSAALAQQLTLSDFESQFKGKNLDYNSVKEWFSNYKRPTPHAQRSYAKFQIELDPTKSSQLQWIKYINEVEGVLKTPVQTAVKREDEQEFARLNGAHLMFCEDAARKIQALFDQTDEIFSYKVKVSHKESLHPHDATAIVRGRKS